MERQEKEREREKEKDGLLKMPVIRCQKNGKNGWKVENTNNCFIGPDAKKKAERQLRAIKINQNKADFNVSKFYQSMNEREFVEIIDDIDFTIIEKAQMLIGFRQEQKK